MYRTFHILAAAAGAALLCAAPALAAESACVACHKDVTPAIVKDFQAGEMGKSGSVDCADCHGIGS